MLLVSAPIHSGIGILNRELGRFARGDSSSSESVIHDRMPRFAQWPSP